MMSNEAVNSDAIAAERRILECLEPRLTTSQLQGHYLGSTFRALLEDRPGNGGRITSYMVAAWHLNKLIQLEEQENPPTSGHIQEVPSQPTAKKQHSEEAVEDLQPAPIKDKPKPAAPSQETSETTPTEPKQKRITAAIRQDRILYEIIELATIGTTPRISSIATKLGLKPYLVSQAVIQLEKEGKLKRIQHARTKVEIQPLVGHNGSPFIPAQQTKNIDGVTVTKCPPRYASGYIDEQSLEGL